MVSLQKNELEYINNFYVKDGKIRVIDIYKNERLCIVSIPIIDGQEDITDCHKIITVPVDYNYDGDDVEIYNFPKILDNDDIFEISETIWEAYNCCSMSNISIKYSNEIAKDIEKRGEIKVPDGYITGEEHEKWLRRNL